jgi:sialic acid synthase SpsE
MLNVQGRKIGKGQPVFIIAEIGNNHNGSLKLAKQLVDLAVEAGVDA